MSMSYTDRQLLQLQSRSSGDPQQRESSRPETHRRWRHHHGSTLPNPMWQTHYYLQNRELEPEKVLHGRNIQGHCTRSRTWDSWTQGSDTRRYRYLRPWRAQHGSCMVGNTTGMTLLRYLSRDNPTLENSKCFSSSPDKNGNRYKVCEWFQIAGMVLSLMVTAFPIKSYEIHILHQSWIFDAMFAVFKPLLDDRMKNKMFFHGADMESLHQHIAPTSLPKKYGGTRNEFPYHKWIDSLTKNRSIVEEMQQLGYIASEEILQRLD